MSNSRFFDRRTGAWSGDRLLDYLKFRYLLLRDGIAGSGGLAAGHMRRGRLPVFSEGHFHAAELAQRADVRKALEAVPVAQLLHPNPFLPSGIRQGGLRCWDSVLALPDSQRAEVSLTSVREIKSSRRVNTHWLQDVPAALARTGPLGRQGTVLRPSGAYVYDLLRANPDTAWDLLETAHALVHSSAVRPVNGVFSERAGEFKSAVAEVVTALLYNLPVSIGGPAGASRRLSYGTEVVTCDGFQDAAMLVPALTHNAPRLDTSVAYMLAATYTQPHPASLHSGVLTPGKSDRWCGMPSIVALAGWETVEFVTRQALLSPLYRKDTFYAAAASDLMPPSTYWAHLKLATDTVHESGAPVFAPHHDEVSASMQRIEEAAEVISALRDDPDYDALRDMVWERVTLEGLKVYTPQWATTDHYAWLIARTPPFPYAPCMACNREADGAPARPKGRVPVRGRDKITPDWARWYEDTANMVKITGKATSTYEAGRYGYSAASKRRRTRLANWRKVNESRKAAERLAEINEKTARGRRSTAAARAFVAAHSRVVAARNAVASKLPYQYRPTNQGN